MDLFCLTPCCSVRTINTSAGDERRSLLLFADVQKILIHRPYLFLNCNHRTAVDYCSHLLTYPFDERIANELSRNCNDGTQDRVMFSDPDPLNTSGGSVGNL